MSKFTPTRNSISGQFDSAADIPDGTYSREELSARNTARQASMSKAIEADLQASGMDREIFWRNVPEAENPNFGDALSRTPKPSDAVAGSGDRYGKR